MPENKPFVVNDRRKFTAEGELRQETAQETSKELPEEKRSQPVSPPPDNVRQFDAREAQSVAGEKVVEDNAQGVAATVQASPDGAGNEDRDGAGALDSSQDELPPPPTAEEIAQVARAFESTVERLDTAMRATNPGGDRLPAMSFERFVQSLYMQGLLQLGSIPEPGQPAQVDLMGARQTIDMLAILAGKTEGNLNVNEQTLLDSAVFELRMGFLDVTQALARQAAAARQTNGGPGAPGFPRPSGPSIVR